MLDLTRLENVKQYGDKLIAACPACQAEEQDRTGNHLAIFAGDDGSFENGRFTCIKHEHDSDHRKVIFSLVGVIGNERQPLDHQARKQYAIKRREEERKKREDARLTKGIQDNLERKLEPYLCDSWRAELFDRSPIHLDDPANAARNFIEVMFPQDAILWMGDVYDAGKPEHRANFKTCKEWLKLETLPPRIAPAHFREESYSRTNENIIKKPFIIFECDEIIGKEPNTDTERERNKQLTSALALFAIDKLGLNLRAVIDSGNKSLHLWFDRPPESAMNAIERMILGLRIDATPFRQSNIPLRMPGCIHIDSKKPARLLYLNHISENESI